MDCGFELAVVYSSSPGLWLVVAALAGVVAGIYLFFNGFKMLRYKRLILNTPQSKIHSASIGLVEVTGTPVGPQTLSSPVTGEPCYYYRVQAWQWEESDKDSKWKQVLDESMYVPFFLEDNTGKVLVDSEGAAMDVHKNFSDEIYAMAFSNRDLMPTNIRDFLVNRGLVPYNKIKVEERIIQPGFPLFVFGTLGENPGLDSFAGRPHVSGGGTSAFDIRVNGGGGLNATFGTTRTASGTVGRGSIAAAKVLSHVPGVDVQSFEIRLPQSGAPTAIPAGAAAILNQMGVTLPVGVLPGSATRAAVMDAGTHGDSANKSSDDESNLHASVAICKGDRNEPFTISCRSQREVVQTLGWKSTAFIWGGPVLALICLYFLMMYWQWVF
jgi:hypothetical protein